MSIKFCDIFFSGFVICAGSEFQFVYREKNETETEPRDVAELTVTLDGSHASLGEWPHWCLGNMSRCTNGLTVDLWIKFAEIAEDASDIIVFSTGGHTWYSNGVYLLQVRTYNMLSHIIIDTFSLLLCHQC